MFLLWVWEVFGSLCDSASFYSLCGFRTELESVLIRLNIQSGFEIELFPFKSFSFFFFYFTTKLILFVCVFLPVLRGKLMWLFISGNWRKCWKSLSLNFGGKLSKVLRVHNSKQITEETLINDIFFCLFQRRNWGFHQNEIKWLN